MRIVITGGTGSIGRRLVPALVARGDRVVLISRRPRDAKKRFGGRRGDEVDVVAGDCQFPGPWQAALQGADAVVHLAGAGVADQRWSRSYRELIERSRVDSTHQVVSAIEEASARPPTLVCASGTGYYGDTGTEAATERFPAGKGFLADVCVRWEEEARRAEAFGVRVVRARIGVVLDEEGPLLRRMLPWFRAALGAFLGHGQQFMPWVHYADCVAAIMRCIDRRTLLGPVNIVAPEPCEQRVFARALGRAVGRPVFLPVPHIAVRCLYGGIADELFKSQRVVPKALLDDGMEFQASTIDRAFELLLEEEEASLERAAPARRERRAAPSATLLPKPSVPSRRPKLLIVSADALILEEGGQRSGQHAGQLSSNVRDAIRAASSHGCAVVLATEASSLHAPAILAEPLLHPIAIVSNGAVLWNERERLTVHIERIEKSIVAAVLLAARRVSPGLTILFEGDHWLAGDREIPPSFAGQYRGTLTIRLGPNELPIKPVARIHLAGTPEEVALARAAIETPLWRERKIALFARGATRLVVTSPLVDRAVAAQRVARRLGIEREDVMALTGVLDDLGLTDWCGFAVATADAPDAVRRLAAVTLEPAIGPVLGPAPGPASAPAPVGGPSPTAGEVLGTVVQRFISNVRNP